MSKKHTLLERVEILMEVHEESRNSDTHLTEYYWLTHERHLLSKDMNGKNCITLQNLQNATTQESIKRVRAIIQNVHGRLLPTKSSVRKARRISEQAWIDFCIETKYGGIQ